MKIDDTMHPAQVTILHALLFRPAANFSELQKASKLSSDHFNFHLKQMVEQGVVLKKDDGTYELTQAGKEYANRFDTDERVVERQPKIGVLVVLERDDGKTLAQQRQKQPFFGYWGRVTGKVRWGETIMETAARELMEETGLTADLEFKGVYHKMDYKDGTHEMLEDKVFMLVHGTNPRGTLKEQFDGGTNAWLSPEELLGNEKVFEGIVQISDAIHKPGIHFEETSYFHDPKDY
ncbi:MAG TPA: NUDIX domain-containing protein [Candidatus Saccharimonadales bacterium]|nr:NUDIX domain-containing protein [Candidatus Saccharimonadales bacterium]